MDLVVPDQEREIRRLAALHEYRLLDSPADDELEAVVRVAAAVANVPTATLNLIDEHRQCQLTTVGFEGGDSARTDSMCAVRFEAGDFMYTPDASKDPHYRANPWVTGVLADVRLYGSAPLITPDGYALGSLCVFHDEPGTLDSRQIGRLKDLSGIVLALFERRRQARLNRELALISEARQRWTDTLLETIDVAVVAADQSGRLTVFNRAAREWHGLDADPTLEPQDFSDRYQLYATDGVTLLPPSQIPLLRALREGTVDNAEIIIKRPEADPVHVTASGRALISGDGTPMGAVVAMTDVTTDRAQQRAIEAARRELAAANEDLRRSNADLTNFAGAVSHDLVSPLSAVHAHLELLEETATPETQRWVAACQRAVTRMRDLIGSLLQYAQAGSAPVHRVPADLGDIVDQVLDDLQSLVEETSATVEAPKPLPVVACDPVLARQLLQNLIANSIKYRHPDRPAHVTVTATRSPEAWQIAVTDNGVGIPPSQRDRVFEMFTRLDDAPAGGHGIGLSSCLRIVDRHGGAIRVEENPTGGTRVIFTLPD
ncbi:signal transduction histidine kinase [Actinoplanes lutulentus]|uniref:Sensor-like histidine kinase SenX3 n=1 Tax=Actinoplanes lutulentus TaxID=1287878 RepID=A0A327ZHM2_9ACTN|nr:ATP-binding protein [Actinoplanes lutulentus]MBB2946739.1 signal transduction histidine kinase [Actinoplanes lutulentus]RAK35631.1 phospho-acceptor domain-containing protein [Actinoplanes lutulentus]